MMAKYQSQIVRAAIIKCLEAGAGLQLAAAPGTSIIIRSRVSKSLVSLGHNWTTLDTETDILYTRYLIELFGCPISHNVR